MRTASACASDIPLNCSTITPSSTVFVFE